MHSFPDIAQLFETFLDQQALFSREPANLYDPCRYLLAAGGKRIRPALCLMSHELFAPLSDSAYRAALALELFHNFTLMHDDIMDEAPLRRGQPTVHTKFGLTAGILSGDVMNVYAYQQLAFVDQVHLPMVLAVFNQTAIEVCEGQQWDFDFESKDEVSVDNYLKMIELKTSVLLAASMRIGAIIGGATDKQAEAVYHFGKYLGLAFQIQDDYLDVFGSPALIGKQVGGDILARKKTILYTYFQELAGPIKIKILEDLYLHRHADLVSRVTALFQEAGVDVVVKKMVGQYTDLAFAMLGSLDLPKESTAILEDLFLQLLHRTS